MNPSLEKLSQQRDQFLGFAFACADAFLEIDSKTHLIQSAFGTTKLFFGENNKNITGLNFQDFIDETTLRAYEKTIKTLKSGIRSGSFIIQPHAGKTRYAMPLILNIICLPSMDQKALRLYIGIKASNLMEIAQIEESEKTEFQKINTSKDAFLFEALDLFKISRSLKEDLNVHFVDLGVLTTLKNTKENSLKDLEISTLRKKLLPYIKDSSANGQAIVSIDEDRYIFISETNLKHTEISAHLAEISKDSHPQALDFIVADHFPIHTLSTLLNRMDDHETLKAMIYAFSLYCFQKNLGTTKTLKEITAYYLSVNAPKQTLLKNAIKSLDFDINFHPICSFTPKLEIMYHEVLFRLRDAGFTREWIALAEDSQFLKDLDIAIFERTLNYIQYKNQTSKAKLGINLTLDSLNDKGFQLYFLKRLNKIPDIAKRLVIEVNSIHGWTKMLDKSHKSFYEQLQEIGVEICLDDFRLDKGYEDLLPQLNINALKIHEKETQNLVYSEAAQLKISQLVEQCQQLDIRLIAEKVEDHSQLKSLKFLKINAAQGFIFTQATANLLNVKDLQEVAL